MEGVQGIWSERWRVCKVYGVKVEGVQGIWSERWRVCKVYGVKGGGCTRYME